MYGGLFEPVAPVPAAPVLLLDGTPVLADDGGPVLEDEDAPVVALLAPSVLEATVAATT